MSEAYMPDSHQFFSGYNDNRIVLLARDPHWLYAYWELSEENKKKFYEDFGHELWEKSLPVLKVTNVSKNERFYIRINDFSDNWYINVSDSDSLYVAEIGRMVSGQFFINLASSNYTVTPGENVSMNTSAYFINYKDTKNGTLDPKSGKIYETYNELLGINLAEHLGVNSENLVR